MTPGYRIRCRKHAVIGPMPNEMLRFGLEHVEVATELHPVAYDDSPHGTAESGNP